MEFTPFPKMQRLRRECIITEKIDGTNASICITEDDKFLVGSRTRWITPQNDNYGFAAWAYAHEEELRQLGKGHHFGEWWGAGIQRRYNIDHKRFSLFNTIRWHLKGQMLNTYNTSGNPKDTKQTQELPACCHLVPLLYRGVFSTCEAVEQLAYLKAVGSIAAPGFMNPEGIVIYHIRANTGFKLTIDDNEKGI